MTTYQSLSATDLDRIAALLIAALDGHRHRPTRDEKSVILRLAAERLRRDERAR